MATGGKKLRQMDELFDEIKSKHETHNFKSQIAPSLQNSSVESKGSFDTGDPTTTNLFVGNLNPQTTGTICNCKCYFLLIKLVTFAP